MKVSTTETTVASRFRQTAKVLWAANSAARERNTYNKNSPFDEADMSS